MMMKLRELSKMYPAFIIIAIVAGIPSYMAVNAHSQDEKAHPSLVLSNQEAKSQMMLLALEQKLTKEQATIEHERLFKLIDKIFTKLDRPNSRP